MKKLMVSLSLFTVPGLLAIKQPMAMSTTSKKGHPCVELKKMSSEKAGQMAEMILYAKIQEMNAQQMPLVMQTIKNQQMPEFKGPLAMVARAIYTVHKKQNLAFMQQELTLISEELLPMVTKEMRTAGLAANVLDLVDGNKSECCKDCINVVIESYVRVKEEHKDLGLLPQAMEEPEKSDQK